MKKDDRLEISIKFNFFGIVGPTGEGIIKFINFAPPKMNENELAAFIKYTNMDMAQYKKLILELFELEFRKLMMDKENEKK